MLLQKVCRDCGVTPIPDELQGARTKCDTCEEIRIARSTRRGIFFLFPLWLPLLLAGIVVGVVYFILRGGFRDGIRAGNELLKAFTPPARPKAPLRPPERF